MEEEKKSANRVKGIRFPPDLSADIETTAIEDDRDFSKQVFHLVRLGLAERRMRMKEAAARNSNREIETSGEEPRKKSG